MRRELAAPLLNGSLEVDGLELLLETSLASRASRRQAIAFSRCFPSVVHATQISLGSACGLNQERARQFGDFAKETRALAASEHISFCQAAGRQVGHLTALPFSRTAAKVVAVNAQKLRRSLPDIPLYLENVAWGFRPSDDEMGEGEFHALVCELSGCQLLLDVANVYANALNADRAPEELLTSYPLDRVAMMHIAGGKLHEGFYFDTHAHPISPEVLSLARRALGQLPGSNGSARVPLILERDHEVVPIEVAAEVDLLRRLISEPRSTTSLAAAPSGHVAPAPEAARPTELAQLRERQARTASLLLDGPAPQQEAAAPEDLPLLSDAALARGRGVLLHKRVDEALDHLPRTALRSEARAVAFRLLAGLKRTEQHACIADALAVAHAIATDTTGDVALQGDAKRDLLVLRAQFHAGPHGPVPRRLPWIGLIRTERGRLFAARGFGRGAHVLLMA